MIDDHDYGNNHDHHDMVWVIMNILLGMIIIEVDNDNEIDNDDNNDYNSLN